MPVSRATHEALKTAHAALKAKYRESERKIAAYELTGRSTDTATADTITRLHAEATALRGLVANLIVGLEATGRGEEASDLRRQLGSAGVDLTDEIAARQPSPDVLPAKRVYTVAESRLVAELHRRNKAAGALEDQLFDVQRVNEAQALLLRQAEGSPA
ncbi:hypothetical protein [Streptomyces sp. XY006]|uniref:hypothetical protein n=1 Tax=Streptomyces sp. XY006 TaxID=2021410 RepID=UPI000B8C1BE9|nr:hypothetical protein [Streptomyces sp. XY006]OXS35429.1 hypothetical protein CHR28_10500 [Streptomyces sp. XY006]